MKTELDLTKTEVKEIRKSLRSARYQVPLHDHAFYGRHIRFGYYSDPHVGEKHFHEPLWHAMCKFFIKEGIRTVYCPGDNLEGMSGRPGHIYELSHIGATAQLNYAAQLFREYDKLRFYVIDGN